MRALMGVMFAAILSPLGLRLVLPFVDLPEAIRPFEALLIAWTDLLATPFAAFDAGIVMRDFLRPVGVAGRLDPLMLAAFAGWSIIQAAVLIAANLLRRNPETAD